MVKVVWIILVLKGRERKGRGGKARGGKDISQNSYYIQTARLGG